MFIKPSRGSVDVRSHIVGLRGETGFSEPAADRRVFSGAVDGSPISESSGPSGSSCPGNGVRPPAGVPT